MQTHFKCTNCGTSNQVGDPACRSCGMQVQYSCPNCRLPIQGGDPVCHNCGNTLSWPSSLPDNESIEISKAGKEEKRSAGQWALTLTGVVLVIAIAAAGIYVVLNLNKTPVEPVIIPDKAQEIKQEYVTSDNQPPQIRNITVRNVTENSVVISWTTDEESTTQIFWHTNDDSTNASRLKEALVLQHSEELIGLKINSTYYFQVRSADNFNNESTSEEMSFDIGKEPVLPRVEVSMHTMTIEEQPSGKRTLIRGQIINTGDIPVKTKDIKVLVNIDVPGRSGSGEIRASLDPAPEIINPGDTHKFVAEVPNDTSPVYTIAVEIISQSQ